MAHAKIRNCIRLLRTCILESNSRNPRVKVSLVQRVPPWGLPNEGKISQTLFPEGKFPQGWQTRLWPTFQKSPAAHIQRKLALCSWRWLESTLAVGWCWCVPDCRRNPCHFLFNDSYWASWIKKHSQLNTLSFMPGNIRESDFKMLSED